MSTTVSDLPHGNKPSTSADPPPEPPSDEGEKLQKKEAATFLGTTKRLPEFSLVDRVVLVTGAARGLGLTQAEALLEAGATVYALDVLPEPSPDFPVIQKRATEELGTTLHYRQVDVRDNAGLNKTVKEIADAEGRIDGLIAAAGIQKETSALEYTQEDANHMFSVNITGVFMTAQAVAKQMIRFKKGGSIVLIGSMSAHVANRV
jgi:NAD(P)-dependent dehydrogenase (short-subunit alcohol dehydrogenase family)